MGQKFNDGVLANIANSFVTQYEDSNIKTLITKAETTELSVTERNVLLDFIERNKTKVRSMKDLKMEILKIVGYKTSYAAQGAMNRGELEAVLNYLKKEKT